MFSQVSFRLFFFPYINITCTAFLILSMNRISCFLGRTIFLQYYNIYIYMNMYFDRIGGFFSLLGAKHFLFYKYGEHVNLLWNLLHGAFMSLH